jgi:integrase
MARARTKLWNNGKMKGGIRQRSLKGPSWEIAIDLGRDPVTGDRRQRMMTIQAKNHRAAVNERNRLLTERDSGSYTDPSSETLGGFLERWDREYVVPNVRSRTGDLYRSIVRNRILPHLGAVRLSRLTTAHVLDFYQRLREGPRRDGRNGTLSAYSLRNTHRVLKQALNDAVKWGLINRNPANVDGPRVPRYEMRALTAEEVNRLLDAARDTEIGPVVSLAVYTGMRRSELLGLRWGDVDFDLATIQVGRGLHRLKGRVMKYETPKSRHGQRLIDLSPSALFALPKQQDGVRKRAADLGILMDATTPVFVRADLSPMTPDAVSHRFARVASDAGLGNIGMHVLRHTHATLMLQQGVHPLVVSRRLGHASVQITLDTYSHVVPSIAKAAAVAFETGLAAERATGQKRAASA